MDGVCGTTSVILPLRTRKFWCGGSRSVVHRNYRNILECDWLSLMLVHVLTDSGPGLSVPKNSQEAITPNPAFIEYLSESFSLDQGNIRAGLNICSLLLSRE